MPKVCGGEQSRAEQSRAEQRREQRVWLGSNCCGQGICTRILCQQRQGHNMPVFEACPDGHSSTPCRAETLKETPDTAPATRLPPDRWRLGSLVLCVAGINQLTAAGDPGKKNQKWSYSNVGLANWDENSMIGGPELASGECTSCLPFLPTQTL